MKWISIKDQLPPKDKKIIIFDKEMGVDCAIFHLENEFDIITNGGWDICEEVTHWMPLPPPPHNQPLERTKPLNKCYLSEEHKNGF